MKQVVLEAFAFIFIAVSFIICVAAAFLPWLREAFPKRPRHEAIILQFARPARRGGRNV